MIAAMMLSIWIIVTPIQRAWGIPYGEQKSIHHGLVHSHSATLDASHSHVQSRHRGQPLPRPSALLISLVTDIELDT